jgi:hypothetical protein
MKVRGLALRDQDYLDLDGQKILNGAGICLKSWNLKIIEFEFGDGA